MDTSREQKPSSDSSKERVDSSHVGTSRVEEHPTNLGGPGLDQPVSMSGYRSLKKDNEDGFGMAEEMRSGHIGEGGETKKGMAREEMGGESLNKPFATKGAQMTE